MKYSDFVEFWENGRENWKSYTFEVANVADKIYKYFLTNMEPDRADEYLSIIPLKNKDDDNLRTHKYTPFACIEFEEYGWANVGISLLIEKSKNTYPKQNFIFKLMFKKNENGWIIKISDDGKEHRITTKLTTDELEPIWQNLIDLFKDNTINSLELWLKSER